MKASGLARMFAIAAVTLAAVGCDDSDEGGGTGMFVGTWMYTSGTSTTNCGAGQSTTEQLMGNVSIQKGVSSPLISVDEGCSIALDVNGATASARSGQACSRVQQGTNFAINITAYTFTVNGTVADESGSATVVISAPQGNLNCNFTSTGKLTKISQ